MKSHDKKQKKNNTRDTSREREEKKQTAEKTLPAMVLIAALLLPSYFTGFDARAASVNLIQNPSAETATTLPESWNQGQFGTNEASFSYPTSTAGFDGSRSLRIDMTEHSNGDAKWYPADVSVTPGKTYVFSDVSRSDVSTGVDVRYKMGGDDSENEDEWEDATGTHKKQNGESWTWSRKDNNWIKDDHDHSDENNFIYIHLGDIPANSTSSTSTLNQFTFTVPEGATSATIFHLIENEGYLITDKYSLVEMDGGPVTSDTIAPAVSITSPLAGATVSGTTTAVSVNASDNVAVTGVKLLLDGTMIGTEMTSSPYNFIWNTTGVSNGTHSLTAIARDTAGNIATSTAVSVTVNNAGGGASDTILPSVSITSPADGTTVSGSTTINATATDNVGVIAVKFVHSGTNHSDVLIGEDTTSPYSVVLDTTQAANGVHQFKAIARDAAGNVATSSIVNLTINNATGTDHTLPVVSIVAPPIVISGTTTIAVNASDDASIAGVKLFIDDVTMIGLEDTVSPYEFTFSTLGFSNGSHTLKAMARDAAGNVGTSTILAVTINNATSTATTTPDTTLPSVSVTYPVNGATVSGTTTVTATATDNVSLAGVRFLHNDLPLGAEDTAAPYEVVWNTASSANGVHSLKAIARDTAGNIATSSAISVTVNNATSTATTTDTTVPNISLTAPIEGATVSGSTTLSALATDNVGVAGVKFYLSSGSLIGTEDTTQPFSVIWNSSSVSNGEHTILAVARDAAGNVATSSERTITVNNATSTADTIAPTIAITSPTTGATVYGTTTISATTTDNVGVAGVKMMVDGTMLGTEMTVAPFDIVWNTTGVANGAHSLTAIARDAAGNVATSSAVSVTVNNATSTATTTDTVAPTISITSPANNAAITGPNTVTVNASDNVAVAGVKLFLDGVVAGDESTVSPYSFSWNSTSVANGAHTISAEARDAAGNIGTSTPISITVTN
ncbi:MAG: Ig-like domain-containing protein [Candidatus Paceibacterota bacterium]